MEQRMLVGTGKARESVPSPVISESPETRKACESGAFLVIFKSPETRNPHDFFTSLVIVKTSEDIQQLEIAAEEGPAIQSDARTDPFDSAIVFVAENFPVVQINAYEQTPVAGIQSPIMAPRWFVTQLIVVSQFTLDNVPEK
jgi:hypothetical protein